MAFTEQDQIDLMYSIVGAFNASPGRTIYNDLAGQVINGGLSQEDVVDILVAHPLFSGNSVGAYPISQTNTQFATEYLTNLLGARGDLISNVLWDAAKDVVVGELNGGTTRGEIVFLATQYLQNDTAPGYNPLFQAASDALANKVEVALYQAVELELDIPGATLDDFRAPIADVDNTAQSVTDAKAALDSFDNGEITDIVGAPGGTIAEDAALGAAVGVTADADFINTPTYSLTDDAGGRFAIDANTGVVTVAGALDFESNTSHSITVQANNGNGKTSSESFTINITNVNDNGVSAITDTNAAGNSVNENSAGGTSVGISAFATDGDVGTSVTYSLSDDAGGKFAIDANTGAITTTVSLDREAQDNHNVTVLATSSDGSQNSRTFNILVNNVNEGPDATGTDLATIQDTSVDGAITATDPENDNLNYAVSAAAANGSVNLNGDGTFTYVPNDGFAGDDTFDVTVTDGNGGVSVATVNVTVADVADILTVGVDNINLSGAGQVVTGNHLTYNPGDIISGVDGAGNTLHLGLTPGAPIILGSATVTGIDNLLVNVNPAVATDTVTLLMTLWDTALDQINIVQSLGESFSILDLQNTPITNLDDVSGLVMVEVDNQVVAGGADALDFLFQEFGTNSSGAGGRSALMVDDAVETINIRDDALSGAFASDLTLLSNLANGDAGAGFGTVNITGGLTGVDLTFQAVLVDTQANNDATNYAGGFSSIAGTGITVDSTGFAGDLVADIDGAGTGIVNTGVGADDLTAHDTLSAAVNTGAGADIVHVSTASVSGGSITTESGSDNVRVEGSLISSSIDGGSEGDILNVTGAVDGFSSIAGGTGNDDIDVGAGVAGLVEGEDGVDDIDISGGVTGTVTGGLGNDFINQNTSGAAGRVTGTISGGEDSDVITNEGILGDRTNANLAGNQGTINGDSGEGDDTITQNDDMEEGSAINGNGGNDVITVNGVADGSTLIEGDLFDSATNDQNEAMINGGDGMDTIRINNAILDGDINAGNDDDTVIINDGNHREGSINLGDGDDDLIYLDGADFTGDGASGPYSPFNSNDGSADGGAGENTVTLRTNDDTSHTMEIASDRSPNFPPPDATDFLNFQELNLEAIDVITTGNIENDQLFQVELMAFDSNLDTINVLERDDSATVELDGYAGEVVNIDSDGDAGTDVTLNILGSGVAPFAPGGWWVPNGATVGSVSSILNVNLNGTAAAHYDTAINDDLIISTTNLGFNGTGSRDLLLDGMDADNNGAAAGEGNSLIISGDNTGLLTVFDAAQATVDASGIAGSLYLEVDDLNSGNESLTINTAGGDDWVDMTTDMLELTDSIHLGDGVDRLAISNSTRTLSLVDEDQVFEDISGVDILRAQGDDGGTLLISIEDDFRVAGSGGNSQTIEVMNLGLTSGKVDIDIDADYLDDHPDPANAHLQLDVRSGTVDIDNGADVDLTVDLYAEGSSGTTAIPVPFVTDGNDGVSGSGVMFTDTGNGQVDLNITVARSAPTVIASTLLADDTAADPSMVGHVGIDVVTGSISPTTITLVDVDEGGFADNSAILMTWDRGWSTSGLDFTVDASGIANDDFDATPAAPAKDNDGTNTGGLTFIGVAETDHGFALDGTQNDDVLWGGQDDDHINGNDGDDEIWGDPAIGQVVLPGVQEQSTIDFDITDVVEAGDAYQVTIGGAVYTWTAPDDAQTVIGAVAALVSVINGGVDANVSVVGNIDDGDNTDDVSASIIGDLGTIQLDGIGEDAVFGYALGEDFSSGEAINRPTTIVTIAAETYDIGDVVEIDIDGTLFTFTITTGLETASDIAAGLTASINGGAAGMSATDVGGGVIELRGDVAETTYCVTASLAPDLLTTPATNKTVLATFSGLDAGEIGTVFFTNGVSVSGGPEIGGNDLTSLVAAINIGTSPVFGQWTAADLGGGVLALTAVAAGATPPTDDFVNAAVTGGSGTVGPTIITNGLDAVVRTDNTDPTVAARSISFDLTDAFYDGGDSIDVTINGVPYSGVLPGVSGEDDINHTPAVAAGAAAAALNALPLPAGYTASAVGSVVTVTADDSLPLPTWAVAITDVLPNAVQEEIIDIDYTGFVAGPNAEVSVTIGATPYSAASVAALEAAVDADTGTHGYDASVVGDVLTLTGTLGGDEPTDSLDAGILTAEYTNDGGAVVVVVGSNALATPATETIDFSTHTDADGANIVIGATTYTQIDIGLSAATLGALADQVNVDTGTHGWTASVVGTDIVLTGPADGSAPAMALTSAAVLPDGGSVTAAAPTAGVAAVAGTWTVTAIGFDDAGPGGDSVSVTFDQDGSTTPTVGDAIVAGDTWADLAATITANIGGGLLLTGITSAVVSGSSVVITGRLDGSVPAGGDEIPVDAGFAGTGGPASVSAFSGNSAATPWSQTVTVTTVDAGETIYVNLADGTQIAEPWDTDIPTTLANLGASLQTAIGFGGEVAGVAGNVVTLNGPADGSNPAVGKTVDTGLAGDILAPAAAVASVSVAGVAADPYDVTLDFDTNGDPGEVFQVTLAASLVYTGVGATEALAAADLLSNINAATGTHGWTASGTAAAFVLTGPTDGTAPAIAFVSAEILATSAVTPVEIQESWNNLDNTDPTLKFLSGVDNTDSVDTETITPVAAETAGANGDDVISGGLGEDTIMGMGGADTITGDEGDDVISGGDGGDVLSGNDGNDVVSGNDGVDVLNGDAGDDMLMGGDSGDLILGGTGDDTLIGGDDAGMDTLTGGSGFDFLDGGLGRDILTGGNSPDGFSDIFYFEPGDSTGQVGVTDHITDFETGVLGDVIQLDLVGGGTWLGNVNDTTNLLAALNGGGGPVAGRTVYDTNADILYVDVLGTGDINSAMTVQITTVGDVGLDAVNVAFV